jgi:hypothetical protein
MDDQRTLESFGYKQELHRSVATVDLVIYGLVFMVPIAPWAIFGTVYNSASGMVPLVFLAIELVFVVIFVVIAVRAINGQSLARVGSSTTPIWNPETVSAPLIAAALSIAVLSFLGFDGISTSTWSAAEACWS